METINAIELKDENIYPDQEVLKRVLGDSYDAYLELLKIYDQNGMSREWRYYKDGKAWLCKVRKKNRTMVWMSAWKGYIQATIYFPEKYTGDIYNLEISDETKTAIKDTGNVGRSKPCVFRVVDRDILKDFQAVMRLKVVSK